MVEIGSKVPRVNLVNTELKQVEISGASSGKPTVIAFFPGAFTSVCTKEMCTIRDNISGLGGVKAKVYAISVDGPFANKAFKEHNKLEFELLSDYRRDAVRAFGVELNDFAHLSGYTAAKRAVFITDSSGTIRYKWVSDDPTVEPKYDEIAQKLKELK